MVEVLFLYSLPEEVRLDKPKQQIRKQAFHALWRRKTLGICVRYDIHSHIPVRPSPISEGFHQPDHVAQFINYLNSKVISDFCPYTSNLDRNISQVIDMNTDKVSNGENDIFTFQEENINDTIEEGKRDK